MAQERYDQLEAEMPGRTGLDAAADLRRELPSCRVLILTTFGRPGYLRRAMEAGAGGFLIKDGSVEELADAIRRVLSGQQVIDPALAAAALSAGPNPLTDRERARCPDRRGRRRHCRRYRATPLPVREHRP
jgi:two-component system, NarL family, response regulator DesR